MPAQSTVSFATCNLFNINEPGLPMYRDETGWNQDQYVKKIDWLSQAIRTVNADVWHRPPGYQTG